MRVNFNAPVVIFFTTFSFLLLVLSAYIDYPITDNCFCTPKSFNFLSPISYFKLVSYVLGHTDWLHLRGNFLIILLVGPLLEEKYGSKKLLLMMLIVALATSIPHTLFSSKTLLGASGIASMLIALGSITNTGRTGVAITFFFAYLAFFADDVNNLFRETGISHFGHLMGAALGVVFSMYVRTRVPYPVR